MTTSDQDVDSRIKGTTKLVEQTIVQLTQEWLEQGIVATIRQIGDGLCEEFAEEALLRIHAEDPTTQTTVIGAFTDDWWIRETDEQGRDLESAVSFECDIARLRREGAPLPGDLTDDELSLLIGGATHMWIVHNGIHHDATAPGGASHFLLMPFFADQIAGHRLANPSHDVTSDGVTVWVSGSSGECLGRFGRMGIDIHQSFEAQIAGEPQCLECTHGPTTIEHWNRFRVAMVEHYSIEVPEKYRPLRFG